ncbi:FAD-binding monooxygenase [Penicillium subrubescens]|uniref:FAD-binding monooxygenase n=1 Tax=Penicillium subrubescens TaxID=1316194 RepID=UPI002545A738|nr:FAD-binding monooxygenase [Penicillium subrubescens]KAJ5890502.1 FAD-binding monooxygenase [Penicillium subrubescens]
MVGRTLIDVAIIGGGPGGLGTAIALSQLPFVHVTLYEKNPEPREAGAGISLSTNAWKVLDLLGASDGVKGGSKSNTHQRNAHTGAILSVVKSPENSKADSRGAIRARRTRLQSALLSQVPEGILQYDKKLTYLETLPGGGVRLLFHDQTEAVADLVVGADGIQSIVRRTLLPGHHLSFTGTIAWRVIVPKANLTHIPDITSFTSWWWGESGHVYLSDVDDDDEENPHFEITVRGYREPEISGKTVVWGIPATNDRVASRVQNYDQRIKDAVNVVPEGLWREFAMFAGPRLDRIIGWDNRVALIGDASHPLSGAFGSGATFAMEDGWILARALEHTQSLSLPVGDALEIFNTIRSPYYARMYEHLDESEERLRKSRQESETFDDFLNAKIKYFLYGDKDFIYKNDIQKVWEEYIVSADRLVR